MQNHALESISSTGPIDLGAHSMASVAGPAVNPNTHLDDEKARALPFMLDVVRIVQ